MAGVNSEPMPGASELCLQQKFAASAQLTLYGRTCRKLVSGVEVAIALPGESG
jgi:hypothetical protein